ncbi:MAG: porin family protein [Roseivirga sp.]|nr:porin family protein [Roseivirga sp.]
MKKLFLTFSLLLTFSVLAQAQSKLSYSALVNQSASTDDIINICIFRTTGGECLDLDKVWKTNITLNVNYQVNPRIRLQSGLGYNVFSMDQLNQGLGTDKFKIKYLSIPVRAHYFFNKGKVRVYTGVGLRTDIRLNGTTLATETPSVADNGRGIAASMEGLLGIEVPVSSRFKIHFEPTYSKAITSYANDVGFTGGSNSLSIAPYGMIDKYPGRIGISLGFTFQL